MAVTSACSPAGRIVVVANGMYGERIAAMASAARIAHTMGRGGGTAAPGLAPLEDAGPAPHVQCVAGVHHETTTGLVNPVAAVGAIARRHGRLLLVDSVSGLGGDPLDLEATGADLVAGTANKCIQGLPGMAFVLARTTVLERLAAYPPRSVY